jgi:DNA-binding transcriptional regulator YdaS (Cro superfamily)
MKLSEYIATSRGKATWLADCVGVEPAAVSYWASGHRSPTIENCKKVEFVTGGQVTCEDLRPDLNWDYLRSQAAKAAA